MGIKKKEPKHAPSNEDLAALEAFSASFDLEEISFNQWAKVHASLDLHLELKITREEALAGGSKTLSYTRTIQNNKALQTADKNRRQKVEKVVSWPQGLAANFEHHFVGEGDIRDNEHGSLHVKICIL